MDSLVYGTRIRSEKAARRLTYEPFGFAGPFPPQPHNEENTHAPEDVKDATNDPDAHGLASPAWRAVRKVLSTTSFA